jgi:hypothetical protein
VEKWHERAEREWAICKREPWRARETAAAVEATYLATLKANVTQADLAEIVGGLVERAKSGDLRAIDLLFRHVLPTPQQRMVLDARKAENEFRVAGMTPDEVDKRMLRVLSDTVREQRGRRAREASQAAAAGG